MTRSFDFSDPLIRDMVARSHVPQERWIKYAVANEPNELAWLRCETCQYPWPCPTRLEYLKWRN